MREPEEYAPRRFGVPWSSLTVKFLIAYALVFLLELFLDATAPANAQHFRDLFALSNYGLAHGYVWQFVTYQFMHAGFLHLFLNGWAIYSFGLALEAQLGPRRFFGLMIASGIIGGVLQSAVAFLWPQYFGGPVVGASACAFGLVAAFAVLHPDLKLQLLIFFVIPLTLTARNLLIASVFIALVGFGLHADNVAHAAHLGGMVAGWLAAKKIYPRAGRRVTYEFDSTAEKAEPAPFSVQEVDAVLDKISASGIKSLTAKERAILESARKKMSGP